MPSHLDSQWAKGPIVVAGNWEPLIFRRRLNSGCTETALLYEREHTAAWADRLKDLGVTLLITHYFKGFGLAAEADDIAAAEKLIELCHDRDIHVAGYIGDTFIHETMLLEEDALSWAQRTADGRPITMGATSSFRYKWCRNNPAYLSYMQRVIERAVSSGLDMLHFDNFLDKPEPLTCRCDFCAEAFRNFLTEKYTAAQLVERLGFSNITHVIPPSFSEPLYISWDADTIVDPLHQEWIDFRCQTMADTYGAVSSYAKSLKPDMVIECNPQGIIGENSAYMRGVDFPRLLPHGTFFWDETPNAYGLLPNGALSTNARSMKMGEALGNRVFFYCFRPEEQAELKMAEALAFNNGCLGMIGFPHGDEMPDSDVCRDYARLLNERPELFCNTSSMARVAVLRQFESLAYDSYDSHLQTLLAEQTLLQNHVPFDLVFGLNHLDDRLLIIAGMECLCDAEVDRLKSHIYSGGKALLIGRPGRFDSWRRERPTWPFEELFANGACGAYGTGYAAWMPELEPADNSPTKEERAVWDTYYKVIDSRFWLPPNNAEDLVALLGIAELGPITDIETSAPSTTLVEPRLLADGRMAIHVINYDLASAPQPISIRMSEESFAAEVELLIPGQEPAHASSSEQSGRFEITADINTKYSLLLLHPAPRAQE
jgi:hypothetical protein